MSLLLILVLLHFILLGFLITEFVKLRSLFKSENRYKSKITSVVSSGGSNDTLVPIVEFIDHSGKKITIITRSSSGMYKDWEGKQIDVFYLKGMSSAVIASPRCMWDTVIILAALYIPIAGLLLIILLKYL